MSLFHSLLRKIQVANPNSLKKNNKKNKGALVPFFFFFFLFFFFLGGGGGDRGGESLGEKWLFEARIIHDIVVLPVAIFRGNGGNPHSDSYTAINFDTSVFFFFFFFSCTRTCFCGLCVFCIFIVRTFAEY